MLQVTVRSGGVERRVAVCRQCHRTCLAKSNLRQQQQQQQFAADSNSAIGKHWLATWLSCSMLHESSCIPSVMVEYRYAGVDRAAGYWGKQVWGSCWTLKNIYSRIQSEPLKGIIVNLLQHLIGDNKSNRSSTLCNTFVCSAGIFGQRLLQQVKIRLFPEASKPPAYMASKFWDDLFHRALSKHQALPNTFVSWQRPHAWIRCRQQDI